MPETCPDHFDCPPLDESVSVVVTSDFDMSDGTNIRNRLEYWVKRLPWDANVFIRIQSDSSRETPLSARAVLTASWKEQR